MLDPATMALVNPAMKWAEAELGEPLASAHPLRGGWTSTMLDLTTVGRRRAVLRVMTKEPWRTHAQGLLEREAATQSQLSMSPIPAPRSLALNSLGARSSTPAHLMTHLDGRVELERLDPAMLVALVRALMAIHTMSPVRKDRPRTYQSWAVPEKRIVPAWARDRDVWDRAIALLNSHEPPPYRGVFLHRDFHLGNVLWEGSEISGIVDWVETSWGPAQLDVAHASNYIAMLHGPQPARDFELVYRRETGDDASTLNVYWDVLDVVGFLPDPTKIVQPWRDQGVTITDHVARMRLEEQLRRILTERDP